MLSQIGTSAVIVLVYVALKFYYNRPYVEAYDLFVALPLFIGTWIGTNIGTKRRQAKLDAAEQGKG